MVVPTVNHWLFYETFFLSMFQLAAGRVSFALVELWRAYKPALSLTVVSSDALFEFLHVWNHKSQRCLTSPVIALFL